MIVNNHQQGFPIVKLPALHKAAYIIAHLQVRSVNYHVLLLIIYSISNVSHPNTTFTVV